MKLFKKNWLIPIIGLIFFEDYLFWIYGKIKKNNMEFFQFTILTLFFLLYHLTLVIFFSKL